MYEIYAGDELLYSDIYPNHSRKVTSPTLKMAVDGAGSLEFTVSEVNKCYTKLQRMKTIITVKKFGTPIWDGRIVEEYRDYNKNKKMYVEGSLTFLNDSCQPLKEYANKDLSVLVTAILDAHNSVVKDESRYLYFGGCAETFNPPQIEFWTTQYEYTLDTIKNLAEYLECHFVVLKDTNDGYKNKIYFFKDEYKKTSQSIVFTKNLLDYTEQYDLSKLATVLLPLAQTDRESADKPINVGTTIDLTTPKPCGEDGWGVFCPLAKGWVQEYSDKTNRSATKGSNHKYFGGYPGKVLANPDATHTTYSDFDIVINPSTQITSDFVNKKFITDIIPLGSESPWQYEGFDLGTAIHENYSWHAYQFVIEDLANEHNRANNIKAYLYYRTAGSSDSWALFAPSYSGAPSDCSGWGLYNDDSYTRWPNKWSSDPARLAFEVQTQDAGAVHTAAPDPVTYDWAIKIEFSLPEDATYDTTQELFATRIKMAKLFAIAGVAKGLNGVKWIEQTGEYSNSFITVSNTGSTGIYRKNVLNLRQDPDQNIQVRPWAYSAYPLVEWSTVTDSYSFFVGGFDKIFTNDFDIRIKLAMGHPSDIVAIDLLRYARTPINNPKDLTINSFGWYDDITFGDAFYHLQCLNYGWLKYHPKSILSNSMPCVAVLEIDLDVYKSYFLSTRNRSLLDTACVATVWKIKETGDTWIDFDGRDDDVAAGCEYHVMAYSDIKSSTPFVSLSAGRVLSSSSMTHEDLSYDSTHNFKILNPDKYEFVSADYATASCFEKEMFFYYTPEEGYSHHILLALYSADGNLSVTLATEEEKNSVLAIGQDGFELDKEHPLRHDEETGAHDDSKINNVYDETLHYGTLVPSISGNYGYRLPNLSEYTAMTKPYPNVWPWGGYYPRGTYDQGDVASGYDTTGQNEGIVLSVNPSDTNYKVCSFIVKPSYTDSEGKECPQSIYISTTMKGKSGMYAIFELSKSNGEATTWTGSWVPKCRAIEYGKYINGITTYNQKKITLPYCDDKETLLEVLVASYNSEPSVWLHDPELANKMSYLTIASVNNGEIRLYGDSDNVFTSAIEPGSLNDQNGSVNLQPDDTRCRTKDFVEFTQNAAYGFRCSSSGILARVYVYDVEENFQYVTNWSSSNPVIFVSGIGSGYKAKVEFQKTNGTDAIKPSDILEAQLYPLEQSIMADLSQGPLKYRQTTITNTEIYADSTDGNADMYVSTTNYYTVASTDKINLYVSPNSLPRTIVVNGVVEDVVDAQFFIKILYQTPVDSNNETTYPNDPYQETESLGICTFEPSVKNIRFKAQLRVQVAYMNGDTKTWVNASITPNTLSGITLSILKQKPYAVPNKAYETYGHIEKRIEFDDVESSQELMERAQKYLNQSQFDEMTLKVKALDMTIMGADVDSLGVADKINVSSPPHGLYKDFVIREMSIPFDKISDTTFELGFDNKDSLAKLIRKEKSKW